jgi:hypothetical protein
MPFLEICEAALLTVGDARFGLSLLQNVEDSSYRNRSRAEGGKRIVPENHGGERQGMAMGKREWYNPNPHSTGLESLKH